MRLTRIIQRCARECGVLIQILVKSPQLNKHLWSHFACAGRAPSEPDITSIVTLATSGETRKSSQDCAVRGAQQEPRFFSLGYSIGETIGFLLAAIVGCSPIAPPRVSACGAAQATEGA
jgi:hypothetical protein